MENKLNVLVTDDQPVICEFIRRVLCAKGHACELAANGRECLEQLRAKPFDLLFLDLIMPGGLDGKQTLLAALQHFPDLPVVIISVQDCERDILHLLDLGAVAFISKPFTANDLEQIASRILARKAGAGTVLASAAATNSR